MNFKTQYRNRPVIVDLSGWSDTDSLEGVEIICQVTGEEIDYDSIGESEWFDLWEECRGELTAARAEYAMELRWD